ncbi:MAG: sodium:solute symporter [Bacteroidetes bacterium]|nr:MAG: sodium:solute symporter [Bacteroidota bacterium]
MILQGLDIAIVLLYIGLTVFIGFWISRRASKDMDSYFLGGNTISWPLLGLSNASGMFDISGTMWMVYLLFVYGLKSVWVPWLWPVFNQIFMMVFLSVWLRRSGVMTGAEWITFRFGKTPGSNLSHIIVVIFAIMNVIGFLAYGFIGIGKFTASFLPWQLSPDPVWNANLYGLIVTAITTLYVVKGGMFSVVFTEVLQFIIMTIACLAVGIIAMMEVSPEMLKAAVPEGWSNLFFQWKLEVDWSNLMPAAQAKIEKDGWTIFGAFWMMMLFKGWLQSMAGPAPNYDMQRVLSAKTPIEAAKMSGFVNVVLLIPRYMLITGLGVLALVFFSKDLNAMGDKVDFELILPFAMKNFIPQGVLGLLIAGLLAAFMSTYAATVNAAPAYLVNDIYKRYIRPDAPDKVYVRMSYLASVLVVIVGTAFGFVTDSLNDVVQWIVAALYGGYTASNMLKWYWWRFNSYGYFWGMLTGIVSAIILSILLPEGTPELYTFPLILVISLLGCVIATLLTPPDDDAVLMEFYRRVRPWGFWKPVHDKLLLQYPDLQANRDFGRDMVNVVVGMIWQTALTAAGIYLVIKDFQALAICAAVIAGTTLILKFNWYDKLKDAPVGGGF